MDLLARIASCSTAVIVQLPPVYRSGSVPTVAAVSVAARPVAPVVVPTATTTAAAAVTTVNQPAAVVASTTATSAAVVPSQPTTSLGASLTSSPVQTASPVAESFADSTPLATNYAPFSTPIFGMPQSGSAAPASDATPPPTGKTTTSDTPPPPTEPTEPPTEADGAKSKSPQAPKVPKVNQVELTSDVTSPQAPGTTIALTAKAIGGVGPYQYQWRVMDSGTWSLPTEWTEFAVFTWTAETANPDLGIEVGVRSAGSVSEAPEARHAVRFVIKAVALAPAPTPPAAPAKRRGDEKP
jgi:hypothetical protein